MRLENTRDERAKTLPLDRLARGQRKSTHRPAMERAIKRDEFLALGMVPRELHRRFNSLRPGIAKNNLLPVVAGRNGDEFLRQLDHSGVIKVRARHMYQVG